MKNSSVSQNSFIENILAAWIADDLNQTGHDGYPTWESIRIPWDRPSDKGPIAEHATMTNGCGVTPFLEKENRSGRRRQKGSILLDTGVDVEPFTGEFDPIIEGFLATNNLMEGDISIHCLIKVVNGSLKFCVDAEGGFNHQPSFQAKIGHKPVRPTYQYSGNTFGRIIAQQMSELVEAPPRLEIFHNGNQFPAWYYNLNRGDYQVGQHRFQTLEDLFRVIASDRRVLNLNSHTGESKLKARLENLLKMANLAADKMGEQHISSSTMDDVLLDYMIKKENRESRINTPVAKTAGFSLD